MVDVTILTCVFLDLVVMVLTLLSDSTTYKCLDVQCTLLHCLSKWTSDLYYV